MVVVRACHGLVDGIFGEFLKARKTAEQGGEGGDPRSGFKVGRYRSDQSAGYQIFFDRAAVTAGNSIDDIGLQFPDVTQKRVMEKKV